MANMTFKASLLPNTDLGYSLGSENQRWKINNAFVFPVYYSNIDYSNTAPIAGAYTLNAQTHPVTGTIEYGNALSLPGTADGTAPYAAQLIISSASGQSSPVHAYIRRLTDTPLWSNWSTLLDNNNYTTYTDTRYLKLSGGTLTGNIERKMTNVDASKTNNNVSEIQYPTTCFTTDVNGKTLSRLETIVHTDGRIGGYWYCRNYSTSGTEVAQKGITMYLDKNGTMTYGIADAANFRSALGLGARATDNTAYLPLAGGAMTGAIQWNGRGQNSIYNGPNDQASGVGGTLNNLVISSWYGVSFTTNCAGTYQGKNAVSINARTGDVYANSFNGVLNSNASSIGGSWVNSRDKAAVSVNASDSSSSVAYSLCRIKFPSKTFAIGSERAYPQFGIYGWNNSRTENGVDWCFYLANNGYFYTNTRIYGAVWNDYAEKRNIPEAQKTDWKDEECIAHPYAGRCVRENGDDTMSFSTERLQKGCKIISDTFGYCVGETDDCKTPIAVSGRALVYLLEDRETAKEHIGDFVCSGPNGTVSIMTTEEYFKCPQAVVGTISAIPDYEEWGTGHVKVDGRIWIYVR